MKKKILGLSTAMTMGAMSLSTALATNWGSQINTSTSVPMPSGSEKFIGNILGALQGAGMIVGIFILIFFGFKYLTAGAGEKAKTKEMMVPFLIGAAVVMLAPTLANWIFGTLLKQ